MEFHFEWLPLIFLGFTTLVDLIFRYLAFGRLESIALDIAFFATAYNFAEFIGAIVDARRGITVDTEAVWQWTQRVGLSIILLLILVFLHRALSRAVEAQANRVFDRAAESLSVRERKLLDSARPALERSVLLTFVGTQWTESLRLREGKLNWRSEVADVLNNVIAPANARRKNNPVEHVRPDEFLLPRRTRMIALAGFAVLGTFALLTPYLSFNT